MDKSIDKIPLRFHVGATVRKRLKRPTFTKGCKQIWGQKVFKISKIEGIRAILDNEENVKINDLQVVIDPIQEETKIDPVEQEDTVAKQKTYLKREGIDEENIILNE